MVVIICEYSRCKGNKQYINYEQLSDFLEHANDLWITTCIIHSNFNQHVNKWKSNAFNKRPQRTQGRKVQRTSPISKDFVLMVCRLSSKLQCKICVAFSILWGPTLWVWWGSKDALLLTQQSTPSFQYQQCSMLTHCSKVTAIAS